MRGTKKRVNIGPLTLGGTATPVDVDIPAGVDTGTTIQVRGAKQHKAYIKRFLSEFWGVTLSVWATRLLRPACWPACWPAC